MKIRAINNSLTFNQKIDVSNKKIYLLTNSDKFNNETSFFNAIEESIKGGVDLIQFREKNMPDDKMITLGAKLKKLCAKYNVPFIVDDKIKVAKALNADGIHLGQNDESAVFARKILGEDALIGISAPNPNAAKKAVEEGADYLGVGPVFKTPLKDEPVVGMEYLRWVVKNIKLPIFAIGGINMTNIDEVLAAGIKQFCFIRTIINSENPKKAAETYLKKLV